MILNSTYPLRRCFMHVKSAYALHPEPLKATKKRQNLIVAVALFFLAGRQSRV
jgi:hypothetical protein